MDYMRFRFSVEEIKRVSNIVLGEKIRQSRYNQEPSHYC